MPLKVADVLPTVPLPSVGVGQSDKSLGVDAVTRKASRRPFSQRATQSAFAPGFFCAGRGYGTLALLYVGLEWVSMSGLSEDLTVTAPRTSGR